MKMKVTTQKYLDYEEFKNALKHMQETMYVFIGLDGYISGADFKRIIRNKPKRLFLMYPAGGCEELQMDYNSPWGFVSTLLSRKGGEMEVIG